MCKKREKNNLSRGKSQPPLDIKWSVPNMRSLRKIFLGPPHNIDLWLDRLYDHMKAVTECSNMYH